MVNKLTKITGFSSHALRDWLVQRVTAVILGVYSFFLLGFFILHPSPDYFTWHSLFTHRGIQIFSMISLLSLFAHAWVGIWTIVTDYIKPPVLRLLIEVVIICILFIDLAWGLIILWGTTS